MVKKSASEYNLYNQSLRNFWNTATQRGMAAGWLTLAIIVASTIFIWYETKTTSETEAHEKFEIYSNEIKNAIIKRISAYEQVLKGGRGLFAASDTVTRQDWQKYVRSLEVEKNYPGILGIGYSVIISPGQKEIHEKQIRSEGFPDYKIWPDYKRNIYSSIIYLEPFEGRNLRAFGYDMLQEPVRKKAMELARDSGSITVSDKVKLVQETSQDVQAGFLMYLPHYQKGYELNNAGDRRKALLGFVYSPFRMNDLMSGILSEILRDINLEIYDKNISQSSLMYVSSPAYFSLAKNYNPMFTADLRLDFNDNYWVIRFTTLPSFEHEVKDNTPFLILVSGFLTSALIFVLIVSLAANKHLFRELNQLIEASGEGIYGLDLKGKCTFINTAASKMLGRPPEQFYNKQIHNLIHHSHQDGSPYKIEDCPVHHGIETATVQRIDNEVFWREDGSFFPVEYIASPIFVNNSVKGVVVTFNDITLRKETFEKLSNSLHEKVILLKEVHHRVKNNLQIISSLLNLQSYYLKEDSAHQVFRESQNRIRSMALIHEKLYQTSNMSRLNFAGYVQELVMNLLHSYDTTGKVNFRMEIEDVLLNIDTAITLGLSLNEIVSNSLKYAFPGNRTGEIYISLKEQDKDNFKLIISDNGKGLPEDIDYRNTSSLGLQLVNTLIDQLDGSIELDRTNGTKFTILFSAPSEKEEIKFTS